MYLIYTQLQVVIIYLCALGDCFGSVPQTHLLGLELTNTESRAQRSCFLPRCPCVYYHENPRQTPGEVSSTEGSTAVDTRPIVVRGYRLT